MKRLNRITIALILSIFPLCSFAADWAKYTSDHFTIYSDVAERHVIKSLTDFEIFRTVAMVQLGLPVAQEENQKLVIIMYRRRQDFRKTGIDSNTAGFYQNIISGPRMVIGPGGQGQSKTEILFHEYVHHLFSQHSTFNYPRWYMEGMAEVLSSAIIVNEAVRIGDIPNSREGTFIYEELLPITDLIDVRDRSENSTNFEQRFYATSWLLTHYLQIGSFFEGNQPGVMLQNYLRSFQDGENPIEAFESAMGMATREMDSELGKYLRQRRLQGIQWPNPQYTGGITTEILSNNERIYILSNLVYSLGEEAQALEYIGTAQQNELFYPELTALQALILNRQGLAEAPELARLALEQGEDSAIVHSHLAHYEWDRYAKAKENNQTMIASIAFEAVRDHAEKALAIDEFSGDAFWYLALVNLEENDINSALQWLIQGDNIYPATNLFITNTVVVLLSQGRHDLARPFIANLVSSTHSMETRERYTTLLERIDAGEIVTSVFDVSEEE